MDAEYECGLWLLIALQVVATGWNHKVLVWQDDEVDTVSEYRMFSGHRSVLNITTSDTAQRKLMQIA